MNTTSVHEIPRRCSCNFLIEVLAYDEAVLRERVRELEARNAGLEADRFWFREIANAAVHRLYELTRTIDQAPQTIGAMRETQRQARETERSAA